MQKTAMQLEWSQGEKMRGKETRRNWVFSRWRVAAFLWHWCARPLLFPVSSGRNIPEAPERAERMFPPVKLSSSLRSHFWSSLPHWLLHLPQISNASRPLPFPSKTSLPKPDLKSIYTVVQIAENRVLPSPDTCSLVRTKAFRPQKSERLSLRQQVGVGCPLGMMGVHL